MGQKTNPKGFRLITTQQPLSQWYNNKKYPILIAEDAKIRFAIESRLKQILTLSEITILRTSDGINKENVEICLTALFPLAKEMAKKLNNIISKEEGETLPSIDLTDLGELFNSEKSKENTLTNLTFLLVKKEIREIIRHFKELTEKTYKIKIKLIENQFTDARLIAKYIAEQLERRVPFRRTVKQVIKKVQLAHLNGIKIEISGRLNGADIARSEWKRSGRIPLHNLDAKIDYTHQTAETVYGTIGIKVWLLLS